MLGRSLGLGAADVEGLVVGLWGNCVPQGADSAILFIGETIWDVEMEFLKKTALGLSDLYPFGPAVPDLRGGKKK